MVMSEKSVCLFSAQLHIHVSVVRSSHQNSVGLHIERIVRQLEVTVLAVDLTLTANVSFRDQLLPVPVPQENLPIRTASESHDVLFLFVAEGARHKLLRIERVDILNLLRHLLQFFQCVQIKNTEFTLVSGSTTLANRDKLFAFG